MPEGTEETQTPTEGAEGQTPTTPETPEGKAPEFEGEFDAERAKRLVANLRADLAKRDSAIADLRSKVEASSGSEKSLQERLAALEERNAKAERDLLVAKVVQEHSIPDDLVEFLTASDAEGLKAQAERLAAHAAKKPADDVPRKPKARLKPGQGEDQNADDFDPKAVAAKVRRR